MTERLRDYDWDTEYVTSDGSDVEHLVKSFYTPALERSKTYDRAVGYFRSSTFELVKISMSNFAKNGGKMRIVCHPSLKEEDVQTIRRSRDSAEELIHRSVDTDIKKALENPAEYSALQFLATLLEHDLLEIKVTYKPDADTQGIFHRKIGIFHDGEDFLTFGGSANETFMAWAHNEENITPHFSWEEGRDPARTERAVEDFEKLWDSRTPNFKTVELHEMTTEEIKKHSREDPDEAAENVALQNFKISRKTKTSTSSVSTSKTKPKTPMTHQVQARDNWFKNRRGIISFATGGGKTIAAISIIKEWFIQNHGGSVIVLVPSSLLAKQWSEELKQEMEPAPLILQVGGKNSDNNWREKIATHTRHVPEVRQNRIVVAVINSAASESFLNRADVGEHTLLIADEVHEIGAPKWREVFKFNAGGRLGLSATPQRYGDEEGTAAIFNYFGEVLKPIFSIKDAQKAGRLVPYTYKPGTIPLTDEEYSEWKKLTDIIQSLAAQLHNSSSPDPTLQKRLEGLRFNRARIIKKAEAKTDFAINIVKDNFEKNHRWLIYCEDTPQLEEIQNRLRKELDSDITIFRYASDMSADKENTINIFENRGGVMVAMKCLDQGVDIPSISHALILASSTNPRQHIQRRGRVLRVADNKIEATVHDALVIPDVEKQDEVLETDLERARDFAQDASRNRRALNFLDKLSPLGSSDESFEEEINKELFEKDEID